MGGEFQSSALDKFVHLPDVNTPFPWSPEQIDRAYRIYDHIEDTVKGPEFQSMDKDELEALKQRYYRHYCDHYLPSEIPEPWDGSV